MEKVAISGIPLTLSHPDETPAQWVGQPEILERLLACWLIVAEGDLPLCPRVIGKPGVGKTTLAIAGARVRAQEVYIYQCTMDTRPEDLLITPVLGESGKIHYHASPVVTAMIKGAVCILDEGNRMSEKSWASLAPLLDHRRYVESVVAGIKIDAHPNFRACVTMNDDASTYELPDYIMSRLQPAIEVSFPNKEDEMKILKYNVPFSKADLLQRTVDFLQRGHSLDLDISTRDGIHILRYTLKRMKGKGKVPSNDIWDQAVSEVLGYPPSEIEKLAKKRKQTKERRTLSDLAEFFFDPDQFDEPDEFDKKDDKGQ